MKTENAVKLYNSITNIKDEIIEEAQTAKPKSPKTAWLKLGALAACFAFILAVVPLAANFIIGSDKDTIPPLNIISFHDAYYEAIDFKNTETLDRYNLPKQIHPSMIGNWVGVAQSEKDGSLVSLYEYIPENKTNSLGQSVYISKEDNSNEYQFALFCNFTDANADLHPVQDLLNVYTICDSSDICSIQIFETDDFKHINNKTLKSTITDASKLKTFYDELLASESVGCDGYQNDVYKEIHEKYKDDDQAITSAQEQTNFKWLTIKIESTSGAIAYFSYSPDVQYVDWALNYYKVSNAFGSLMDE